MFNTSSDEYERMPAIKTDWMLALARVESEAAASLAEKRNNR